MYSSSMSATHHISFPPRLEVVVEQQNPNCLPSYLRHQFTLHRFFGHQADRPAGATFWRIAADHRDDALFLISVKHLGGAGPLFLVKGAIQAGLLIAIAESANCLWGERDHSGNLRRTGILCKPQECQGAQYHSDLLHPPFSSV